MQIYLTRWSVKQSQVMTDVHTQYILEPRSPQVKWDVENWIYHSTGLTVDQQAIPRAEFCHHGNCTGQTRTPAQNLRLLLKSTLGLEAAGHGVAILPAETATAALGLEKDAEKVKSSGHRWVWPTSSGSSLEWQWKEDKARTDIARFTVVKQFKTHWDLNQVAASNPVYSSNLPHPPPSKTKQIKRAAGRAKVGTQLVSTLLPD